MTLGQLIGPPIGALAATTLGYRGAFVVASAFVFITLAFCFFFVKEYPHEPRQGAGLRVHAVNRRTLMGWGLCFTATVQLMFLPSVLPDVFREFHIEESVAVRSAGLFVMMYTATAMAGTLLLCRLAGRFKTLLLIITVSLAGTGLQFLLAASSGITSFFTVRVLQTAMIAAVMPLVFSSFVSDLDGRVIGFLNSSRFAGNGLGPIMATSVLAFSSLDWLYLSIGAMSLLALIGYASAVRVKKNSSC